ncbi:MAG: 1-deoxy-D-xylulose-5-phosphate synthase [Actinomycetaceae bacterium]|nr:1-deoxy-D-xylulose-5-phosphate synthase [Actinomycetaceae bacterium]MDU0969422.1 1-deoxy-D-xylulose-5-phosphate synthase [Actinomycetaceae bacterium]
MTSLLDQIEKPADLRQLTALQLDQLAAEIRQFLIVNVARTGGHLGPNLGVVELTIALHRVFDSPRDTIVFDTGHQAYVHKILTGRKDFSKLRSAGGLSGYPSRAESRHDVVENSHASASLSWAYGIAEAKYLSGDPSWTVAVIGDGALTGGMAWEGLNMIADHPELRIVIVVNDNARSYAPTIGGLAHHLDALRTSPAYERALEWGKRRLQSSGKPGQVAYDALHGFKRGVQDVLVPEAMFSDLGLKYTGPVDGHDIIATEFQLTRAREYAAPVIVHAITKKGRGYNFAEQHVADRFHAIGPIHPETGLPMEKSRFGWTAVVAEELKQWADADPRLVGITAAMREPVGLGPFYQAHPDRVLDVGIAEQHALAAAAGLAYAGKLPVVALYATFMNRAFDQLLMDCALHKAPVTLCLDRAGVTGADGASHNGMWDIALAGIVPGLRLAAPRDEQTLRTSLREALADEDGPTIVRYPKGPLPKPIPAVTHEDDVDVLAAAEGPHPVTIVSIGAMAQRAKDAAAILTEHGIDVEVVDPVWAIPVPDALVKRVAHSQLVITVEDGLVTSGFGSQLCLAVNRQGAATRVVARGIPREFLTHASRDAILSHCGLDPKDIAQVAMDHCAAMLRSSEDQGV